MNKAKPHIVLIIMTIAICLTNIIKLIEHTRINITIVGYEGGLIYISKINMICLALWLIPYGILLVRNVRENRNENLPELDQIQ